MAGYNDTVNLVGWELGRLFDFVSFDANFDKFFLLKGIMRVRPRHKLSDS